MIKYETINGKLCRMVEPEPLTPDSPMPCIARIVQDDTAMGKYNRSRCCAEALVKKHLITDVSYGGFVLIESGKVYASECWQYEIIGYPVEEGSHWWALWQAENGKSFEHKTAHHCRIFTMFSETELRVTNEEGEVVEFVDIDRFLSEGAKDGWQLYEPDHDFNVGDWVEFIDAGGHKSQGKYLSNAYDNTILVLDITYNMRCVVPTTKITRKLNPSEIVLDFGNGIRGTIRRYRGEQIRIYDGDINFACLAISYVTEPMQTTVRKLLAAIEEERKKQ
jgi:hypothetical protein